MRPLLLVALSCALPGADLASLQRSFHDPPADARIMMRWWWFGPSVTKPELEREMRAMKQGGIGGFEIQPVYPLTLDDPQHGIRNLPFLSDEFLDALSFVGAKAHELGLRLDLTMGSGWPYGGPHIPVTQAAGMLRCDRVSVQPGTQSIPIPDIAAGEELLAVFLARGERRNFSGEGIREITAIDHGRLSLPRDLEGPYTVLFFISSRTGMMVKRPAVGAEGFVLDHYDRTAIENHLGFVGDKLLRAFGSNPPYAIFSDSLEVFASDWTPDLLKEFSKRRGYDLRPYLPALTTDIGEKTAAIRHDWGQTLTELTNERYLTPLREWAHRHGVRFRSQTYGMPPATLSSNALVDLAEGEGPHWRKFSDARSAASASHLYGRPVTSSETWTWLHSPAFRATPLDMKAEADLHFLQGVNQLVGHGWPYSPEFAGRPGWRFYAAAVFNDNNPWWLAMPDITRYLQRVSFLLRQGQPANDIAVYLPTSDAWAGFTMGHASVNRSMDALLGADLIPAVLDAGNNFDFIDDTAIEKVGVPYRVLILPGLERIPLAVYQKLAAFARNGGILIATRRVPSMAPGLLEAQKDTPQIRGLSQELFEKASGARGHFIRDERAELGQRLPVLLTPDFSTEPKTPEIGFIHRKLDGAEVYFLANTSNHAVRTQATFRVSGLAPEWWDPFTGEGSPAAGTGSTVLLEMAPYESRVLVFSKQGLAIPAHLPAPAPVRIDLSADWTVSFPEIQRTESMRALHSWTEDPETRFYSGQAVYQKTISIPESFLQAGRAVFLRFGEGIPVPAPPAGKPGMRALLESPVREAAMVSVNGTLAGSVWRPPYEVNVTRLLQAGENQVRVVVGNLAINQLAGQSLPDYRLLNLRFGVRFEAQDMQNLQPLPAGLLGPIQLETR